jgi:plasmid replication initiation protein
MRIYELLKQYENIGKREIILSELREFCGISVNKYKRFNDFKKDVLERAKQEINSKTGVIISYEESKQARKIVSIIFSIVKNPQSNKTEFEKHQIEKASIIQKELRSGNVIIQELLEYGFTLPHSRKIVKSNDHEALVNAIKSVDIQVERGKARNPKAMLIKAIQEKWHPEKFVDRKPKAS